MSLMIGGRRAVGGSYVEYGGTTYTASQTPIIEHRNLWTRTTFIFIEVD